MTPGKSNKETATMKSISTIAPACGSLRRRVTLSVVALACALGVCSVLVVSPAAAKVIHNFEGSFNGSERPAAGSFSGGAFGDLLPSTAADQSSGDIWVTEAMLYGVLPKADVVDKFNEKGVYAGVQITGSGTPQKEFNFGLGLFAGIAVDNSSVHNGDLYVSDTGHGVVDRFSGSGAFECQITGKKPVSPEEVAHECNGAVGSLTPDGSIEPAGLAVDPSGDVYVADYAHQVIDKFGPSGQYVSQITNAQTGNHLGAGFGLGTITLDSAGNLYVTNFGSDIIKLDSSGNFVEVIGEGDEPAGVGVDPHNNHIYIDGRITSSSGRTDRVITEYEPTSAGDLLVNTIGFANSEGSLLPAFAVGPTGRLYATGYFNQSPVTVLTYSPDIVVPDLTTQPATSVEESSAILHGHLDPDSLHGGGAIETCQFEYGPTKAYGFTAPCAPGPSYSVPADVAASITELAPKSTYHFRLEAAESNGVPSYGEDEVLTTGGQPSIDHASAEALETAVVFRAHINPWGNDTDCHVQYVSEEAFKSAKWANATTVPCVTRGPSGLTEEDLGSGFGDIAVKARVNGLARAAVYHWRFLAANRSGLTGTPESTFETFNIEEVRFEDVKSGYVRNPGNQNYEWVSGEPSTQAGERPGDVVTTITLNKTTVATKGGPEQGEGESHATVTNTRDIETALPPGLVGNPTALPKCSHLLVTEEKCPPQTQVGLIWVYGSKADFGRGQEEQWAWSAKPLYNVEPAGPYPAELGAFIEGQAGAWIRFHVRTGSDYGITADSIKIITGVALEEVKVVVWGVPASHAHDGEAERQGCGKVPCPDPEPLEKPFLTNPTSCAGQQSVDVQLDTWQEPESWLSASTGVPAFTGCDKLPFEPTFEAQPTSKVADSPSGLEVDLHVPQPEGCEEAAGETVCENAEADVKGVKVTLPTGVTVDPSSADGLAACSEAQVGYLPQRSAEVGHPQFTPEPAKCPDASKIGSVEVDSPLIDHSLPGAVYVAAQEANPFRSLLALYITVYDAQTGVVVKLPAKVTLDPATGQLTTTVDEDPQLPFNDFKLDFFPGSRAALTTPFTCGSYSATTDLTPWSAPKGRDATPSSKAFEVTGPNGGACVNSEGQAPNAPGFEAGTASPVAAAYSPFVLHLKREGGSQRFSGLNVTLPPGLIGKIAGIEQCSQSAIDAAMARSHEGEGAAELAHPSCPSGSEVGVVHVGVGSGAPFYQTGHAYFAGPYKGAPFSLVIVTPAVAGPFDLGTVVVRAALFIDPYTAQVTVKSDPLPTIIDGIPLDIRAVNVDMNRGEFTLNPTSCSVMSVTGQEASTAGQTAGLSDRFQAGGCTTLPFHPVLKASTSAKTSRRQGASLVVRVSSSLGQANIAKVHVTLPKQLPSRLQTLKLACSASVFAANPASCPTASAVGTAVAHTPILSSPLTGPAYIVSHGAAFPDLEIVLQGEGVTIILDGKTNIKNGITESSFQSVPDAPVSSFELSLPEGPHSIIAAPHGRLCLLAARTVLVRKKVTVRVKRHGRVRRRRVTRTVRKRVAAGLLMPTTITGQNGAVIRQKTRIGVTGCTSSIAKHKHRKKGHAKRKKHKGNKRGK